MSNLLTPEQEKKIMGKLRSPIHFNYAAHVLKTSAEDAEYILIELEKKGIVKEYNPDVAKGYYVLID
jgi:DNA-binding Lrp family transcriptional regulator